MSILDGFKTCRKGLHQYPADKRTCPECDKASKQRWREQNSERKREFDQIWREQNREKERERQKCWREQNPEQKREHARRWREKNPDYGRRWQKQNPERRQKICQRWYEKNCERERERSRRRYRQNLKQELEKNRHWKKQNPDKVRAYANRRRANKKQATPAWADYVAINAIYAEALKLEQKTKIKHHVDHIYPLQSDYMCGLHVETNLQILTEKENIKKGNRSWPGQLECQRLPLHLNGFSQEIIDQSGPSRTS